MSTGIKAPIIRYTALTIVGLYSFEERKAAIAIVFINAIAPIRKIADMSHPKILG